MYFVFAVPYIIRHPFRYFKNRAVIAPYRGGPSVVGHLVDVLVCLVGLSHAQGILEITARLTVMPIMVPWIKCVGFPSPYPTDRQKLFSTNHVPATLSFLLCMQVQPCLL